MRGSVCKRMRRAAEGLGTEEGLRSTKFNQTTAFHHPLSTRAIYQELKRVRTERNWRER